MEGIIGWFSKNHVAANFLMLLVVVLGVMTWPKLKKEIFPETSVDTVHVRVPFPNATPEEVEKGIIIPIEESIQDLDGIEAIRSSASQGIASIQIEVALGYKVRDLMDDVKTRIDAITNFSEQAEEPVLEEMILKSQVLSLAVSADASEAALRDLADKMRTALLNYQDGSSRITQIEIAGIRDYEISIEVSEDKLQQYGLTFDQVSAAVRKSSLDLPGGSVRTVTGEVLIRTEARRYNAKEFSDITVVTRADGSAVKLHQIAQIRDDFEEGEVSTIFNGRPALLINVMRVGNEDTLKIAKTVKKFVAEEAPRSLPEGAELEIWRDDSLFLKGRLNLLVKNGLFGLTLVAIVLALFLRPSLAFLVALGIPVSFCGAVILMPHTGISINLISLFAFILVLGIVVDDAIVVGENVYRRMRTGEDPRKAAPLGTHEVGVVVIFGILTTIMAFTPMLGLSGTSGKIWPNIPLIVIPTLFFSLLQSKLILPSHLALLRPFDPNREMGPVMRFQSRFARGMESFVEKVYRPVLSVVLQFRWVVFTAFVCFLMVCFTYVRTGHIRFAFFPSVEGDVITSRLLMSEGVPFEATARAVEQISRAAYQLNDEFQDRAGAPVIRNLLASSGTQPFVLGFEGLGGVPTATNIGEVTIELRPAANRDCTTEQLISRWRELTGRVPGAVELIYRTETASGGNAIDLEVTGPDTNQLKAATEELKSALAGMEGVTDIGDSDKEGKRELKLEILPRAEALGLRLQDVAAQIRQGFFGDEIQRLQRGKDEVIVYVRYPRSERRSIADLEYSKIRTSIGAVVPFSEIAEASFGRSPSVIQRTDGQRAIRITADIDEGKGANANEVVKSLTRGSKEKPYLKRWIRNIANEFRKWRGAAPLKEEEPGAFTKILKKYPGMQITFQGEQKDQNQSVREMLQKFGVALMGMYILMAIPLRSYIQPIIIMSVIPFGLIGAIIGHIIMGYNLSIMSMCGIIALAGVVVNDSLVLVDYVNRERAKGRDLVTAAWEAGAARFRPILLTSMTTFAGLTPMLLETDLQARFLIPMAVSLSFGILFATMITLILVPCIYLMIHDFGKLIRRFFL